MFNNCWSANCSQFRFIPHNNFLLVCVYGMVIDGEPAKLLKHRMSSATVDLKLSFKISLSKGGLEEALGNKTVSTAFRH
jgi:hypothetical protein